MKNKITLATFLLLAIINISVAQEQIEIQPIGDKHGFTIHSVNFSVGYYSPEMNYWNNTYLPSKGITETFDGNLTVGANLTFDLPLNFRTRIGASYWTGNVKGTTNSTVDELKIGLTRFNLGFLFAPKSISITGFHPYVGVELHENLIKNTYKIGSSDIKQQGSDISFAPLIGLDHSFNHLNFGFEAKYNLGSYTQEEANNGTLEHKVSIDGVEILLLIGYKF